MIRHHGPNLLAAMDEAGAHAPSFLAAEPEESEFSLAVARGTADADNALPVLLQFGPERANEGESWASFKERQAEVLGRGAERLAKHIGVERPTASYSAGTLKAHLDREQVTELDALPDVEVFTADLDDVVQVVHLDDVNGAIRAVPPGTGAGTASGLTGDGVVVAVIDSGADLEHPELRILPGDSVSVCEESDQIPGRHGTHVAGCIASQDPVLRGIAPGVRLINVKALNANGTGERDNVTRGIDEAIDRGADIISMSLGWNHLPRWSSRGHGHVCPDGNCPLCLAVANAVAMGRVVVVAAGNDHQRAEDLRSGNAGTSYDTELSCPGQAVEAITVGAITKVQPFVPAGFSSGGATADGRMKPDLVAPGVNIASTFPMPRGANGAVVASSPRSRRFGVLSGTSMATPIVAGAVALLIERERAAGAGTPKPSEVRDALLTEWVAAIGGPRDVLGLGCLALP